MKRHTGASDANPPKGDEPRGAEGKGGSSLPGGGSESKTDKREEGNYELFPIKVANHPGRLPSRVARSMTQLEV